MKAEGQIFETKPNESEKIGGAKRKSHVAIAAVAAVAVLAVAVGTVVACNQPASEPKPVAARPSVSQDAPARAAVSAVVKAKGAGAESTKAVVEVLDENGEAVLEAVEAAPNENVALGELPEGAYSLRVTQAPANIDGSTYKLPEAATAFSVGADGAPVTVEVALEKLEADGMSKEQLEAVAETLAENGHAQESQAIKDKAAAAASVPGSDGSIKTDPAPTKPTGNGGNPANTTTPSTEPAKPTHTHDWVSMTEQHWISNIVTVVDQPAYDEQVKQGSHILCSCGFTCGNNAEWSEHNMNNGATHSYSVVPNYATIHHDAVTHTEDQGHYETVIVGYRCSGCGATK